MNDLNLFVAELQLINTKPITKNKLKRLLSQLKKFKVQSIFVFLYKKRNNHKIFHSSEKLIASYSYIDKAFKFMNQSILLVKINIYSRVLRFLSFSMSRNNSIEKWR